MMISLLAASLLFASVSSSSTTPAIILVVIALIGSGGIWSLIDRRSAQASRLAADAVNATKVFQAALEEERARHDKLEQDLKHARRSLEDASARSEENAQKIAALTKRIHDLEKDIVASMHDMNEIVTHMFLSKDDVDEAILSQRWREAMISTKLAVIQSDKGVVIIFVSPECARMLGYDDSTELVGKSVYSILASGDLPKFNSYLRDESAEPFSIAMLHKDGHSVPVLMVLGIHKTTITLLIRGSQAPLPLQEG